MAVTPVKRTSRDIRTANRYEVLRQIIAESPTSRQELASATGLSLATVATLVGELLDLRMITEVGFEDSAGGRPGGSWRSTRRGRADRRRHRGDVRPCRTVRPGAERPGPRRRGHAPGREPAGAGGEPCGRRCRLGGRAGRGRGRTGAGRRGERAGAGGPRHRCLGVRAQLGLARRAVARPAVRGHRLPPVPGQSAARLRGRRDVVRGGAGTRGRGGGQPRDRRRRGPRARRGAVPGREQQRGRVGPYDTRPGRPAVPLRQPRLRGGVRRGARNHAEPTGVEPAQPAAAPRRPDGHHRRAGRRRDRERPRGAQGRTGDGPLRRRGHRQPGQHPQPRSRRAQQLGRPYPRRTTAARGARGRPTARAQTAVRRHPDRPLPILTDPACLGAATFALEGALQSVGQRAGKKITRSRTAPPS